MMWLRLITILICSAFGQACPEEYDMTDRYAQFDGTVGVTILSEDVYRPFWSARNNQLLTGN